MSGPRSEAFSALTRFLVTESSVGDTLQRIAEIAADTMSSADMAGMTMLDDDGRPSTVIFTDDAAPEIDVGQYESGRGPCLDAWRTRRSVRIDDMDAATADYPEFSAAARARGVRSSLSLPLVAGETGLGALNLYSRRPLGFSEDDEAVGTDLAAAAAVVTANASAYSTAFELTQQLSQAMESRAVIEQAKGMLMARSPDLTADAAFDLLRRASQRENVKLREIAQRIVDRKPLATELG